MNFCLGVTLPRQRNSDQLILARAPSPDGHCILWIFIIVYTAREAARYFNGYHLRSTVPGLNQDVFVITDMIWPVTRG